MEPGIQLVTKQGLRGYRVTLRRKTPTGVKEIDKFFSFNLYGGKAGALAEATKVSKEFTKKYPVERSLFKSSKEKLLGRSDYKTSELNKATKYITKNKFKTYESLLKKAYEGGTQVELLKSADPLYMKVISTKSLLRKNKGKFVKPTQGAGQYEALYFTDYTNKDFIKDLKNKKGPYQIASEYYVDNPWIEKELRKTGNREYTRPIGYLAKVLTARRKKDDTVDAAIKKYRVWEDKQKVPRTEYEYGKKIKALLPLAIENGIVPPEVNTNGKYFKYVQKNRIDPLMRLFNNLEKIGIEHIGGISRAVDLSDYKTLGEVVPILGGKKVNSQKGILFDRPMSGLAKTAATAPVKEARERNILALNKMAIAAKKEYGVPISLYEFADKRSSKGLQRIGSDRTLLDPLLEDAKLLIKKQVVPQGGSKRKFFKDYPVYTQNAIKAVEAGDNASFIKNLKAGLLEAVEASPTSCKAFLNKAVGGPSLNCIDTINKNPIKAAQQLSETKATSAAVGKVKNVAKSFLNILGLGKKEGVKIFRGERAGASGKMAKYIPGTSEVEFVPYSDKLKGRFFTSSKKVAEQFADDPSKIKSLTIPQKDFNIGTNLARRINVDQMADQLILPKSVINKLKDGTLKYDSPAFRNILRTLGKGKVFGATAVTGALGSALVKQFQSDDPETYLTNDKQANAMILDTADQLEREERMEAVGDAPELLDDAAIAAEVGATAAAIPGSSALYKARKGKGFGAVRSSLGPVGKALSGFATPLGIAAITPLSVANQVYAGESAEDIATNPLNWLGPAFAGSLTKEATRGMNPAGVLSKTLRLGMSPAAIRTASRFLGLPGLAFSLGYEGYDQYKKYTEGRGLVYDLLNK